MEFNSGFKGLNESYREEQHCGWGERKRNISMRGDI